MLLLLSFYKFIEGPLDNFGFVVFDKLEELLIKIYMYTWHCGNMKLCDYINIYILKNIYCRIQTFIYVCDYIYT